MTTVGNDSSFLGLSSTLSGTVADFLDLKELSAALQIQREQAAPGYFFDDLLKTRTNILLGFGCRVGAEDLESASKSLGSELCWKDNECLLLNELSEEDKHTALTLIVDRLKVTSENKERILQAVKKCRHFSEGTISFIRFSNDTWVLDLELEKIAAIFFQVSDELASSKNRGLRAFFSTAKRQYSAPILDKISSYLMDHSFDDYPIATPLVSVPWNFLKTLVTLKKSILSNFFASTPTGALRSQGTTVRFKGQIAVAGDIKPASVVIPFEVRGGGLISKVLPIEEELLKFFSNLPAVKNQPAQEKKSRSDQAALKEAISYRGWTISELLKLSLGDFCIQFKNHPRFRMIANATEHFDLGSVMLSDSIEHLGYQDAYTLLVIRELRKLREEGRVYLPQELTLYGDDKTADHFKEKLLSFLLFYRAGIYVYTID